MLAAIFLAACSYNYPNIDECKSLGTVDLICGLQNPEDFAKIPDEESLIISQFPGLPELNNGITLSGKLSKLSLLSNEVTDYEISYLENNGLGIGEEDCLPSKGSIYPHGIDIYEEFSADGNALSPFIKESSLLAVVNHLEISRIEFFLVFPEYVEFSDISKPTLFWIGCVKAPEKNTYFNDVVIANEKGDFFVGKYYILFDKIYKKEVSELIKSGLAKKEAEQNSSIFLEAKELLKKWEAGDKEVINIWKLMNGWVYEGFNKTYNDLGVDFDSLYYESETYLIGKEIIKHGLEKQIFYKKNDGSVWIDLSDQGLDEKLLLRSDGTSVYMTQDLGTAYKRYKDNPEMKGLIYTVGNEQDYHFNVLFKILKKLGFKWAENLFHLSYGMVDLPSGKMKSREGTVVDADELILEMTNNASKLSKELGKLDGLSSNDKKVLNETIGLGALKYYILKVDPKKRILFDPNDSIDFNGNTGPFIQYTYARIQSLLTKSNYKKSKINNQLEINDKEKQLLKLLTIFPEIIKSAADNLNPALIANYTYELVKNFNSYYQTTTILKINDEELKGFRLTLSYKVASIIKSSMKLLGINVPEKM